LEECTASAFRINLEAMQQTNKQQVASRLDENGYSAFLQNIGGPLPDYMVFIVTAVRTSNPT
jgi:hypothetical protein